MRTTAKVLHGHVLDMLRGLPDGSMHCCVTSPPYFNLRSYGGEPQVWGDGWAGHLGLEPDVAMYVAHLVEVFEEVRRVLRADGTLWLNLGDSYMSGGSGPQRGGAGVDGVGANGFGSVGRNEAGRLSRQAAGLKPKDMIGVPWRVAFALQAAGWYLRSDIVWEKPNCLPESVTDRPTKSHEYVFLLSKSDRYFYDRTAIMDPGTGRHTGAKRNRYAVEYEQGDERMRTKVGLADAGGHLLRNRRSVWRINPEAFTGGLHFAVMPTKLAEPCVLAGTSARGVCEACGAPWVRQVEEARVSDRPGRVQGREGDSLDEAHGDDGRAGNRHSLEVRTVGWLPTCSWTKHTGPTAGCGTRVVPATVLDPFAGTSTVGVVALNHGRSYIGCELNAEFVRMSEERLGQAQGPGFTDFFDRV